MIAYALGSHVGFGVSEELTYVLRAGRAQTIAYASSGERARALTASMHKRHDEDTDTLIASALTSSIGHHGHSSPRGDGTT